MKISKMVFSFEEVDVEFESHAIIPKWTIDFLSCKKCKIGFGDINDENVIRAITTDGDIYDFCETCWNKQ